MKNYLKRVLALVLAFSMCASMGVVGASAAGYDVDVTGDNAIEVGGTTVLTAGTTYKGIGQIGSFGGGGKDETTIAGDDYDYQPALYVDANGVNESLSDSTMIKGGKYDANNATGVVISDNESGKNGIIVVDADYVIEDATITLNTKADGTDTCDFSGLGSAVAAFGEKASVTISNSTIETTGVATMPVFCDDGATVTIKDSTLISNGGTLYDSYVNSPDQQTMVAPPWILGIMGTARCTNLMGNDSTMNVMDSTTKAANWAVLSTDSGTDMYLNIYNSTLELTNASEDKAGVNGFGGAIVAKDSDSPYTQDYSKLVGTPDEVKYTDGSVVDMKGYGSGYGTYAIGNAVETFAGATVNVGTYATIFTGGTATFTDVVEGEKYNLYNSKGEVTAVYEAKGNAKTVINSNTFGIMAHQGKNTLVMEKGTQMNSVYTSFLVKTGCSIDASISNSTIKNANGVLIQLMDNDDATTGMISMAEGFNKVHTENAGWPTEATGKTATNTASFAFASTEKGEDGRPVPQSTEATKVYTGNIYNATGYVANDKGGQTATALKINVGLNSKIVSQIAPTTAIHITAEGEKELMKKGGDAFATESRESKDFVKNYQNTEFTISQYYDIGHVANMIHDNGNNTIDVALSDNGIWQLDGDSTVTSLSLTGAAQVIIPDGYTLTVQSGDWAGTYTATGVTRVLEAVNMTTNPTNPSVDNTYASTMDGTYGEWVFDDIETLRIVSIDGKKNPSGLATDVQKVTVDVVYKKDKKGYNGQEIKAGEIYTYQIGGEDTLLTFMAGDREMSPGILKTEVYYKAVYDSVGKFDGYVETDIETGEVIVDDALEVFDGRALRIVPTGYLSENGAVGSFNALTGFGYRAAYVINGGKVDVANSVLAERTLSDRPGPAKYEDVPVSDVTGTINGQTPGYSGVIVINGSATEQTKLTGLNINLMTESDGKDVNDFAGYGAGVAVFDGSKVQISDSTITTAGAGKLATFVDEGSDLIVTNSSLYSGNGKMYKEYRSTANQSLMVAPPWVLGISGNARTTNVMGTNTTATYVDTTIWSKGWGAVSSDSGSYMNITTVNSIIKLGGDKQAVALSNDAPENVSAKYGYGYGAYVIGDTTVETFLGTAFEGGTYAIIMTGGTANLASYEANTPVTINKLQDGKAVTTVKSDLTSVNGNYAQGTKSEKQVAYETAKQAYETAKTVYENAVSDKAAYDKYVKAMETYTTEHSKWETNEAKADAWDQYQAALAQWASISAEHYNFKGTGYSPKSTADYDAYVKAVFADSAWYNWESKPGTYAGLSKLDDYPETNFVGTISAEYNFYDPNNLMLVVKPEQAAHQDEPAMPWAPIYKGGYTGSVSDLNKDAIDNLKSDMESKEKAMTEAYKLLDGKINTTVSGTEFGFMFHANGTTNVNTLNIGNDTTISTKSTTFLMKKVNNTVNIGDNLDNKTEVSDGVYKTGEAIDSYITITPANGVLLQVMDNDDDAIGAYMDDTFGMPTFNTKFYEETGWSNTWGATPKSGNYNDALNVYDTDLTGDIWNATGYSAANPGAVLTVTLDNSDLRGAISTAAYQHLYKEFSYIDERVGYDEATLEVAAAKLGHVVNKPVASTKGVNGVNVVLTNGSTWYLPAETAVPSVDLNGDGQINDRTEDDRGPNAVESYKTYYIDSLTLEKGTSVVIPEGVTLVIDGVKYNSNNADQLNYTASGSITIGTVVEASEVESGGMGGPGGPGGEQPGETPETPAEPEKPAEGGEQPGGGMGDMPGMGGGEAAAFPAISWAIVSGDDIISLTDNGDGTATVTGLAAGTATVVATANGENGVLGTSAEFTITVSAPAEVPFTFTDDASISGWAYDAVYALYDMGIVTGYANGDGTFAFQPAGAITRAEVAVMLYRMAGTPAATGTNPFTDATADWYQDAIKWAAAEGVVTGRDATTFDPSANVTRQELVTMLYRAAGQPDANADLTIYHDADQIAAYAVPAMTWAVDQGVVGGFEDSTLRPAGTANREQFATIAYRFMTAE